MGNRVPTSVDALAIDYTDWPRSHISLRWRSLHIRALMGAGLGSVLFELMSSCCNALLWQDGAGAGVVGARSWLDSPVRCSECKDEVERHGLITPLSSAVLDVKMLTPWVAVWQPDLDPLELDIAVSWLEAELDVARRELNEVQQALKLEARG